MQLYTASRATRRAPAGRRGAAGSDKGAQGHSHVRRLLDASAPPLLDEFNDAFYAESLARPEAGIIAKTGSGQAPKT
eukprot:CAMPEP_0176270208 /NCGR_PEP_ID=MMETSP0121_2-20121125/44581_1 /TAXON_ID=160619 /ORGANISM="Kryptoperidinium foliaceum, Strain CCMP 1326" /LENGTH=76 /DNA_ID=CAMNT_0017610345 /DNA_START=84 /DNA_END=314 /DNA_ORIENTATION=+